MSLLSAAGAPGIAPNVSGPLASFQTFDTFVHGIFGDAPTLDVLLEDNQQPLFHEAGVYIQEENALFVTSNYLGEGQDRTIQISRINLPAEGRNASLEAVETPNVPFANGGVNYKDGIVFCAQGDMEKPAGLAFMKSRPEEGSRYDSHMILDKFITRNFNSPNDVVSHKDDSLWFTDPIYGSEQGIRPPPTLPQQVYRFDPSTNSTRAMADGFGRPNGIAFSPDQKTLYVTDTDWVHGDGTKDNTRASTIYAFDVVEISGQPFLVNRRLFAMADVEIPDGIKCDTNGNVYSGCGDGINIWSPGGVLLGKILVPGGAANFCFGPPGTMYILNEKKLWVAKLSDSTKGALLDTGRQ